MKPTTLFVSHISTEAPIAALLKKIIADDFIRIVDLFASSDVTGIQAGDAWLDAIKTAIADSAAVLVLCSETSIHRPWVQFEVGAAWATGKRIIPVCHSGMTMADLPMPLSSLEGLELGTPAGLAKLYAVIAKVAGIPQAPDVKDIEARLQAVHELEEIFKRPRMEQFERYFDVLIPPPGRLDQPTVPDDAIIESDADSLRIFELAPGTWKWRDIVEAARQTPDHRWLDQLQQCIALSSQKRVFRSVQAVYHSKSSGTFQPQLARKEALPNGGTMFHVHLVETVVARLLDVPGEFGLLATVLRLGLRFRYEVITPYGKLLAGMLLNRPSADEERDAIARLRCAIETIERDAWSRGAENIDTPSIIDLFDRDADKQGIARISDRWEAARARLFVNDPPPALDDLRKVMDEMRSINYEFMTLGTRRYHEMVSVQWKPKAPSPPAPALAPEPLVPA
jgi:hypothetical protein